MKAFCALLLLAGGIAVSLVAAMMVAFLYQEMVGTHPDVLGFEDISELSAGQERLQTILALATFVAGLYVTYRLARSVPAVSRAKNLSYTWMASAVPGQDGKGSSRINAHCSRSSP